MRLSMHSDATENRRIGLASTVLSPETETDRICAKGCKYFKGVRSSYIFTRSISENR